MLPTTIAAIATPSGHAGIGIVKVSGPSAIEAALSIFRPKVLPASSPGSSWTPASRHLYYGHVVEPRSHSCLDEVMFVVMRGPNSYTGEDVAEIQAHSGPVGLKSILELLLQQGIEMGGPGEFTRRAFLNGRMDLTQAEAVMDLINARSERALGLAMQQLSGELASEIRGIRNFLVGFAAELEAGIDFPEDVQESPSADCLADRLMNQALYPIQQLIQQHESSSFLKDGARVVIAGSPNVGKSSLLNRLLNRERAIVTEEPGTTRDLIEDTFLCQGIPVMVTDTAGVHDYPGRVERIGIDKAYAQIDSADLVLFILDSSLPFTPAHSIFLERIPNKSIFLVLNKTDLKELVEIPDKWCHLPLFRISAKYNLGMDRLKDQISAFVQGMDNSSTDMVIPNLRHKQALEKARTAVFSAIRGIQKSQPEETIVLDVYEALSSIQEISGESIKPDILEQIFDRFCIGK